MFYTKNVPSWERLLRVMMAAGLGGYALFGDASHGLQIVLWLAAVMMLMTGFIGFCPMCAMVGRKLAKRE